MPNLATLSLPAKYLERCKSLLSTVLASDLCLDALSQIYDGLETWKTVSDRGDVDALMRAEYQQEVSVQARRHAQAWSVEQDVGSVRIEEFDLRLLQPRTHCSHCTPTSPSAPTVLPVLPVLPLHSYFAHQAFTGLWLNPD
jgi:hypothetical protein